MRLILYLAYSIYLTYLYLIIGDRTLSQNSAKSKKRKSSVAIESKNSTHSNNDTKEKLKKKDDDDDDDFDKETIPNKKVKINLKSGKKLSSTPIVAKNESTPIIKTIQSNNNDKDDDNNNDNSIETDIEILTSKTPSTTSPSKSTASTTIEKPKNRQDQAATKMFSKSILFGAIAKSVEKYRSDKSKSNEEYDRLKAEIEKKKAMNEEIKQRNAEIKKINDEKEIDKEEIDKEEEKEKNDSDDKKETNDKSLENDMKIDENNDDGVEQKTELPTTEPNNAKDATGEAKHLPKETVANSEQIINNSSMNTHVAATPTAIESKVAENIDDKK